LNETKGDKRRLIHNPVVFVAHMVRNEVKRFRSRALTADQDRPGAGVYDTGFGPGTRRRIKVVEALADEPPDHVKIIFVAHSAVAT
jgi:hypothetical protein